MDKNDMTSDQHEHAIGKDVDLPAVDYVPGSDEEKKLVRKIDMVRRHQGIW